MENQEVLRDAERMDEILNALKVKLPMPNDQMKDAFLAVLITILTV